MNTKLIVPIEEITIEEFKKGFPNVKIYHDWINCDKELPNDNEKYLVYTSYNNILISPFLPSLKKFTEDDVIYWMDLPPLPEPPKE